MISLTSKPRIILTLKYFGRRKTGMFFAVGDQSFGESNKLLRRRPIPVEPVDANVMTRGIVVEELWEERIHLR